MPTSFNKAIPLFFSLASNAFSDIGLVGRIEKKKKQKKIFTRSLGGPGTPGWCLRLTFTYLDWRNAQYPVKNAPVFVPVFLYAVTMLIFQTKRIISNEKWFNYVDLLLFFFGKCQKFGLVGQRQREKKG